MDKNIIRELAERLTSSDAPRNIPGSKECADRIRVTFTGKIGHSLEEITTDAVYVDAEGLLLVWRWLRISGASEESPAPWSHFVRGGRKRLVPVRDREFALDLVVDVPLKEMEDYAKK